jgi:membrane protein implicated in regulation of membrane protease activity
MDENLRTSVSKMTSVYIVLIGFLCLGTGAFALAMYPLKIWWLGLLLFPLSIYIIIEAVRNFKKIRREQLISAAEQQTIQQLKNANQTSAPVILTGEAAGLMHPLGKEALQVTILARWIYTREQWQNFIIWENKERKTEGIITASLIVILGVGLLRISREAPWWAAILISGLIALVYYFISYRVALRSVRLDGKTPEIVITRDALLVNGHYNRLNGENLWLEKVDLKKATGFSYLEFSIGSQIRNGTTTNEIRVPVPPEKESEARVVIEKLFKEKMA